MATRFYFSSTLVPPRSPAFGGWTATTGAVRRKLNFGKANSTNANFDVTKAVATNPADILTGQFISPPLAAQTITASAVKAYLQALESNAANDARAQMLIRVLSNDMGTVRGTILALDTTALSNEFDTTLTNRAFPVGLLNATLSSLAINDGDHICVEVGARYFVATTSISHRLRFGDATSDTDLAENETDTADGTPWIEFAQDLIFFDSSHTGPKPRSAITELGKQDDVPTGGGYSYGLLTAGSESEHDVPKTVLFGKSEQQKFYDSQGGNITPHLPVTKYKLRAKDTGAGMVRRVSRFRSTEEFPAPVGTYVDLAVEAEWTE